MGWIQRLSDGLTKTRDKVRLSVDRLMGRGPSPEELDELETSLIAADIGIRTVDRFMSRLRQSGGSGGDDGVLGMLKTTLLDTLQSCEGESLSRLIERGPRPFVVLAVGVNGVGKTTTLAKLAQQISQLGKKPLLVAADTFRAAAIEQLEMWGSRSGWK